MNEIQPDKPWPRSDKPPLGLKPKYIHDQERFHEVCGAISRMYQAGREIQIDWIEEYNEYVKKQEPELSAFEKAKLMHMDP